MKIDKNAKQEDVQRRSKKAAKCLIKIHKKGLNMKKEKYGFCITADQVSDYHWSVIKRFHPVDYKKLQQEIESIGAKQVEIDFDGNFKPLCYRAGAPSFS